MSPRIRAGGEGTCPPETSRRERPFLPSTGSTLSTVWRTAATVWATSLLLLLLAWPVVGHAQFICTTNNGTLTIVAYSGPGGDVTIPDLLNGLRVTSIGSSAFAGRTNVTSIAIPSGVTNVGGWAFYGCSRLSTITVNSSNPVYSSVDGVVFNQARTTLIQCPEGKAGSYTVLGGVTKIEDGAFVRCAGLANVTLPDGVTSIGWYAFFNCTNLSSIQIPASVTNIRDGAFYNCTGLTNLTIPNGVASIGNAVFYNCGGLMNVTIGTTVTNIGGQAFFNCASLAGITIPSNVVQIGASAFAGCTNLVSVYFQGNAPATGYYLFDHADLATVYYLPATTGWSSSFAGRPAVLWNPLAQTRDRFFGVRTNRFGFTITGTSNLVVVVEACSNLANPVWSAVSTNTLTGGASYFSDPRPATDPARFYRLRSP